MGHRQLTSVLWIALLFGALWYAQSSPAAQVATPTPLSVDDLRVFPGDLVCNKREVSVSNDGPSWMGITIGRSTLADVEQLLSTLSDKYVLINDDDYDIRFVIFDLVEDVPFSVRLCLEGTGVQALAVTYSGSSSIPRPYLYDLVAQFGTPDAVTWTENPASRVVFWFEHGIAGDVTVLPNEPGYPPTFGGVDTVIYFPYQEAEGYENRWPYNQTRQFNQFLSWPYEGRDDYGPENPFDFEAMIATITAQPSRTPTPTFVPSPSTPTVTPTP